MQLLLPEGYNLKTLTSDLVANPIPANANTLSINVAIRATRSGFLKVIIRGIQCNVIKKLQILRPIETNSGTIPGSELRQR